MSDPVRIKQPGQDWADVDDAHVTTTQEHQRSISIPATGETGARLAAGLGTRWLVFIGDLDGTPEGEQPDTWNGVVQTWIPQGDRLNLIVNAATTIADLG